MLKNNKWTVILSSVVLLAPILTGLLLWNSLPDSIPIHWNAAGEVDDWGSKAQVVFLLPGFMLAMHWICLLATMLDPKQKKVGKKVITLVCWICPLISLVISGLMYATALGYALSIEIWLPLTMGGLFLIIGNFLPKCTQNYSIGIKLPWTLHDEANWNATHRFAGWVWVIGGVLIMATSFLGSVAIFLTITLIMAFSPVVYSCVYHLRHKKGTAD